MENGGNAMVNAIFEARLPRINDKPTSTAKWGTRERFIQDKYERRRFYDESVFKTFDNKKEENKSEGKRHHHYHHHHHSHRSRRHKKPENSFDNFSTQGGQNMDWASDMFNSQSAVPVEPLKSMVTDDSLFSDASDFESDTSSHRNRRRQSTAHSTKLNNDKIFQPFASGDVNQMFSKVENYFSAFDTDNSEQGKKARSQSTMPTPRTNSDSRAPCFQLDSNKSDAWGKSIDDDDADFEPSEFEADVSSSEDSCGFRAQRRVLLLKEEDSKLTTAERKAAKTRRRQRRREARIRARLVDDSDSDDCSNAPDRPQRKVLRKKNYAKESISGSAAQVTRSSELDDRSSHRTGSTEFKSTVSSDLDGRSSHRRGGPTINSGKEPKRTLQRQGSEQSLSANSSGGSKDGVKSVPDTEPKLGPGDTSPSPKSVLDGISEEATPDSRGRSVNRSRTAGNYLSQARGRNNSQNPEMADDRGRSESRSRRNGRSDRSESRSQSRSQFQNEIRNRSRSRSRSSDNVDALALGGKNSSLLGCDDANSSESETEVCRGKRVPKSTKAKPKRTLSPTKKGTVGRASSSPTRKGKGIQGPSSPTRKGKGSKAPPREEKASRRSDRGQPTSSPSQQDNHVDEDEDGESRDTFDPFAVGFSKIASKSAVADDPPESGGQRIRRATLSFGQSCVDHAISDGSSGKAEPIVSSLPASQRRATMSLGAGQGPATNDLISKFGTKHQMTPSSADNSSSYKAKISQLDPPKHDKAVDNLLKNRRLRGAEQAPSSRPDSSKISTASSKSSFKSAFALFQK